MKKNKVTIATRGSKLAIWQAEWIRSQLQEGNPGLEVELKKIKTTGDKILDVPLAQVGGKGLFVKEIEEAMLRGDADLAVHSMKDVPTELPEGLHLSAICKREDPRDAFIAAEGIEGFTVLPQGAHVGTSSLRRICQLMNRRPDLKITQLRGNVDTRLKKMATENLDGIILAVSGLIRLGLSDKITQIIPEKIMLPAIGQGALGIEIRKDAVEIKRILNFLNHKQTEICVRAERSFLKELGGGCQVPVAANASLKDNLLEIKGMVSDLEADRFLFEIMEGEINDPEGLGKRLADSLLKKGADAILRGVYG